ncbi:MAG TPA: Na+/H+ antiporter [Mycobacteriales bacterium]
MFFETLLLVLAAAAVAGLARRTNLSAPLLLVVAGIAVSFVPGVAEYDLEPELVLFFILPPLLFAAAWQSSVINFRQNLRPIGLLSVGLVLFTTLVVGFAVHAVLPDLSLAVCFTLGAIVSPPDAVAATAVGRTVGLPRRLVTILAGESLINDATGLTAYRVAVGAAVAGGFSIWKGLAEFAAAALGGVLVGIVLAVVVERLLQLLHDPVLENSLVLLLPFLAFAAAEQTGWDGYHGSGVLAVVTAGLYLGHRSPRRQTAATRLQGTEVWRVIEFLLESVVFALIGLQLPGVLDALSERSAGTLALAGAVALGATIGARFVWMYPGTYVPRLIPAVGARDPKPPWTYPTVLAWAGMRGVVSLAAASGLPEDFPERDLIRFLTFVVVVGTLLVQGLTLPWLIRRLGVVGSEEQQDLIREAGAQHAAANAALARLDQELAGDGTVPEDVVSRLREKAEIRQLGAWERLGGRGGSDGAAMEPPTVSFRRLRRAMIEAEREVFIDLRDRGQIDDEVLLRVQRELDLEESILQRE